MSLVNAKVLFTLADNWEITLSHTMLVSSQMIIVTKIRVDI